MFLRREASTMGDLVRVKKNVGLGVLLLSALVLATGATGTAMDLDMALRTAPNGIEGTADNPFVGPEPEGVRASQLVSVLSETTGETAIVQLVGDGEFAFSAFQLDSPARFVMDLSGVVKTTEQGSLPVEHSIVAQVRMAQYRSGEAPVSRVVFDLLTPAVPRIESTPEGLAVSFAREPLPIETPAETPLEILPETPVELVVEALEIEPAEYAEAAPEMVAAIETETLVDETATVIEPEVEELIAEPSEEAIPETVEFSDTKVDDPVTELALQPVAVESEVVAPEMTEVVAEPASVAETMMEDSVEEALVEEMPEPAFQIASAEPMWEAAAEVAVEPMPLPEPAAPAPVPAPEPQRQVSDTATFGIGNVQVEPPAAPAEQASAPNFAPRAVGAERRYFGEPMDLSLQDADVKDVLRSFAQLGGVNLVLQPGVEGQVTVELVQVPWDQALEQILKITDLGYDLDGNIMRIAPVSKLRQEAEEQQRLVRAQALSVPLSTVIRRISYARAQEIARVLTARGGVMSQRGSVIVDTRTNTLIIKELPAFMNTVIAIIENLDIPEPQVMIEARIIETTKRFSRSLGIQWGFQGVADAAHGNATGLEFPNNGTVDGGVNLLTGGQNGFINLSLGNLLSTFNLDASLNAAEAEGLINILSAPRVATLNNEQASIQSGLQIPIQTVANNTVSVQFVNATLRLDVTPQVTAEGTVLMDINIQKREPQLAFAVVGASNAPISTKEARTRVIVRDGGTTVIGGIYEVSTDQGEDRVPGLASVPVIKHLFKNKRRQDENEELLIFITPRVTKL
jgi:type IV pilus assembly protein PilQ